MILLRSRPGRLATVPFCKLADNTHRHTQRKNGVNSSPFKLTLGVIAAPSSRFQQSCPAHVWNSVRSDVKLFAAHVCMSKHLQLRHFIKRNGAFSAKIPGEPVVSAMTVHAKIQ